jgi:putative salt-induced outer membrane protein YdiY
MNHRLVLCAVTALTAALISAMDVRADQVVFKNGDKLTGKVLSMDAGKIKIKSDIAGEVTVELDKVQTFSTDEPLEIRTADGNSVRGQITALQDDQLQLGGNRTIALGTIRQFNPPPETWTGSILATGSIARGNTNTDDLGVDVTTVLRRTAMPNNDRITLDGAYNFGRQRDPATGAKVTSTDNWSAEGKYDRFWTDKLYGYVNLKAEHDRVAALNYRLSPGIGLGYQWVETPDRHFNTEAGFTYVYEDYISAGNDDHVALRLAYHFDQRLNERVSLFHNLEYLPAIEDPGDYNLTADAGVRADLTESFFSELKLEWKRDSTPAPDADKNDLRYILGIGWKF